MTVNIFLSGGDGDGYGDFYSPVLTVMGMFELFDKLKMFRRRW